MSNPIDRRQFLKQTSVAGVGIGMAGYFSSLAKADVMPAKKTGASDRITAAVIGTNGRGLAHVDCLTSLPGVEVVYICDVDTRAVTKGIKETAKKQANVPQGAE